MGIANRKKGKIANYNDFKKYSLYRFSYPILIHINLVINTTITKKLLIYLVIYLYSYSNLIINFFQFFYIKYYFISGIVCLCVSVVI